MKVKSILTTGLSIMFFVLCVPSLTLAGTYTILTPPLSDVTVEVVFFDGSTFTFGSLGIGGQVEVTIPRQEDVTESILDITHPNGDRFISELIITIPNSLPSLEPFEIPNFNVPNSGIILTSTIDANAFLAAGNPFTVGQTFSVINGISPFTDAIVFRDQVGNLFSGTVTVDSFYTVEPVPEPATMFLLGAGLAGVAIKTRNRLKTRKSGQGKQ